MGSEQPQQVKWADKGQLQLACMKTKIHLEMVKNKKNGETQITEKTFVQKMKSNSRNKFEESLLLQKIANGIKYAQACAILGAYAATLQSNCATLVKLQKNDPALIPFLPQIYSIIYGAGVLGISSLAEFKSVMAYMNDPVCVNAMTPPNIINLLQPTPTPTEINLVAIEISKRNQIPIEVINMSGNSYGDDFGPVPPNQGFDNHPPGKPSGGGGSIELGAGSRYSSNPYGQSSNIIDEPNFPLGGYQAPKGSFEVPKNIPPPPPRRDDPPANYGPSPRQPTIIIPSNSLNQPRNLLNGTEAYKDMPETNVHSTNYPDVPDSPYDIPRYMPSNPYNYTPTTGNQQTPPGSGQSFDSILRGL